MRCPSCQHNSSRVVDSRPSDEGRVIRRRRECEKCGYRFTTFEKIEQRPLIVVKKEGTREEFSSEKILRGLIKACEKRPVSLKQLEEITADIEKELRSQGFPRSAVPSSAKWLWSACRKSMRFLMCVSLPSTDNLKI